MKERFTTQNIKCSGCVDAIRNGLSELAGVERVEVDISSGGVAVEGSGLQREQLATKLAELGYPEA